MEALDVEGFKREEGETKKLINKSKWIQPNPIRAILVASAGSGKSFWAIDTFYHMLTSFNAVCLVYKNVTPNLPPYVRLYEFCKKQGIIFIMDDHLNKEMMDVIINKNDDNLPSFLIMDDYNIKENRKENELLEYVYSRGRIKRSYSIILTQVFSRNEFPPFVRHNVNCHIFGYIRDANRREAIIEQFEGNLTKRAMKKAFDEVQDNKFSFLVIQDDVDAFIMFGDRKIKKIRSSAE